MLMTYTYDEAVDLVGNGRYSKLLLAVCGMVSNAVALDMFGFGVVSETAACDLHLTITQRGILTSVPFAGLLFSHVWGYIADTKGRRRALIWSTGVGFLCAALTSLASTWYIMAMLKFIGSSFSTAAFTLTITLLGECTSMKWRATYLQILNSMNLAAEFVLFTLSYLILNLEFSIPIPWLGIVYKPWRLLILTLALPLGFGAVMMLYFYESPKFLANQGKRVEALQVLGSMYQKNGGLRDDYRVKAISTEGTIENQSTSLWQSVWAQTAPIFKPPLLWRTMQLYYLFMIMLSTNNVFLMWFPMIVNSFYYSIDADEVSFCERIVEDIIQTNAGVNASTIVPCKEKLSDYTVVAGAAGAIFFTVLTLAISKVASRRKLILLVVFSVTTVSGILVNVVKEPIITMVFYVLLQLPAVCIGTTASYFVDLYPTSYRGMVSSLGFMAARLGSFAGVNLVGAVISDYCELTFYLWSTFLFSGIIVGLFLPKDDVVKKKNSVL